MMTATYDPADNKLRLRSAVRLDSDTYARVKAAGFSWAPKQECFYAPAWTPDREDLLLELCGEIDDEDTTLVERAEQRAERFEEYRDSRLSDAEAAHAAVDRITSGIPLGQPILVGHHSERRARKDAERIDNGMRRAVRMWDTAQYWKSRAAGAIAHAKYKERPDVRHRRIKGLESDQRKYAKYKDQGVTARTLWLNASQISDPEQRHARAVLIANYHSHSFCFSLAEYPRTASASQYEGEMSLWSALTDRICTADQAVGLVIPRLDRAIARADRWLAHLVNRIAYERAMLEESGGLGVDRAEIPVQVGGQVRVGNDWLTVIRLNRKDGRLVSVTTNARYCRVKGIEEIADVRPPAPGAAAAVKKAIAKPPLCNYPGEGFETMTKAEYEKCFADMRGTTLVTATGTHAAHRVRARYRYHDGHSKHLLVYVSDLPRKDAPALPDAPPPPRPTISAPEPALSLEEQTARLKASNDRREAERAEAAPFDALREAARTGVQVAVVPQLFPTSAPIAERMINELGIAEGHRILEPSAGTGNLVWEIARRWALDVDVSLVTVEINQALSATLDRAFSDALHLVGDFLAFDEIGLTGRFDRIVMNPPFRNGEDITHIRHALRMLKPGGRLVALCADGVRQREALKPLAEEYDGLYEPLPDGSFAEQGTNVRVALVVIDLPRAAATVEESTVSA